ncbi:MAG: hypothetical protein GY786_21150, partial [Proteobacteria bacterium]|nr:hypothetical protein [Pseudomonadota bacterium]
GGSFIVYSSAQKNDWENPAVFERNKEKPHADFFPYEDQWVTARFSIPQYGEDQSFNMADCIRTGHISRIEQVSDHMNRVVMQFHQPLDFKPGEQQVELHQALTEPELV